MKENSVKKMVITAILSAIIVIMGYTPLGLIPLPTMTATILHIPVVIGAILYGPKMGLVLGTVMGLTTMTKAILAPAGPLDPLFMNPILSILPRALMGILSAYVFIGLKKALKKPVVNLILTGISASVLNTVLTLGTLAIIYSNAIEQILNELNMAGTVSAFILGIVTTNGVAETVITALAVPPIILALRKTVKI